MTRRAHTTHLARRRQRTQVVGTILPVALGILSACAKFPEDIPARAPLTALETVSCGTARSALTDERGRLVRLSNEQTKIAVMDVASSALIFLPISRVTGANQEEEVAISKGEVALLEHRVAVCDP